MASSTSARTRYPSGDPRDRQGVRTARGEEHSSANSKKLGKTSSAISRNGTDSTRRDAAAATGAAPGIKGEEGSGQGDNAPDASKVQQSGETATSRRSSAGSQGAGEQKGTSTRPPVDVQVTREDTKADNTLFTSVGVLYPPQKQGSQSTISTIPVDENISFSPPRLLLLSSRAKNSGTIAASVLPNVHVIRYNYENSTLDGILKQTAEVLGGIKVESMACVMHSSGGSIYVCSDRLLTSVNIIEQSSIRDFYSTLVENHLDRSFVNARLDFLACSAVQSVESGTILQEMETLLGVSVGMAKDLSAGEISMQRIGEDSSTTVGELYFREEKLQQLNGSSPQTLAGFEKIRTVGKGAYGTAVLYRKKDDDSLVILKEINMHDLTASERQMALNEVKVLAMLDHPNIITYYDSFEEDGVLMIEMEYADGGTLAKYVGQRETPLSEKEILFMFQQIVAAIRHIHEHNILHRDLKTANIFLTKEGVIKVGDFGISKMMTSANHGANTVLGTPYYISPEMCEGKAYNDKSDIWALGCIMYEMACLHRTFEGSNLPALVNKIMNGQFAPVKGNYSHEFKDLIQDMLQREPQYRPSANELLYHRLPELMARYEEGATEWEDELSSSLDGSKQLASSKRRRTRSVLVYLDTCAMTLTPIELPAKIKIRQVAVGLEHMVVVAMERAVYTWGEGSKGQLGHGDLQGRSKPEMVEALKGKSIVRACCGDGFSVFVSDNGIVMTCGDGSNGCLGHGDWMSASRPRLIEPLLSVDVRAISCGPHHVVAVGSDGEVFAWGRGRHGCLGLGDEVDHFSPQEVQISEPVFIREVKCGVDGTMFLTDMGSVLACGNNESNKLGLNHRQGFLRAMKNLLQKVEVPGRKVPTVVRALTNHRAIDMAVGPHHTSVLVEPGKVYTFGRNMEGQLGTGHTKPRDAPMEVKDLSISDKTVTMLACGDMFTAVGINSENALFFWGTRYRPKDKPEENNNQSAEGAGTGEEQDLTATGHRRNSSNISITSAGSVNNIAVETRAHTPTQDTNRLSVGSSSSVQRPLSSSSQNADNLGGDGVDIREPRGRSAKRHSSHSSIGSISISEKETELITTPTPILRCDSIIGTGGTPGAEPIPLTLTHVVAHGQNLFVQVETAAPPPRKRTRKKRSFKKKMGPNLEVPPRNLHHSASSNDAGDEYTSSEASEYDTQGTIPTWIKNELSTSALVSQDEQDADESDDGGVTDDDALTETEASGNDSIVSVETSIQINKELKSKDGMKTIRADWNPKASTQVGRAKGKEGALVLSDEKSQIKRVSTESSVDTLAADEMDHLSSSDSSEQMAVALRNVSEVAKNGEGNHQARKKLSLPTVTTKEGKLAPPSSYRGQEGMKRVGPMPGVQRPLNRLRAGRSRGRAGALVPTVSEPPGGLGKPAPRPTYKTKDTLITEVERLKEEKQRAEEQLEKVQETYKAQQQKLEQEQQQVVEERERKLQEEIEILRQELSIQSNALKENQNIMMSLQDQLVRVQSEQLRANAREKRAASARSQPISSPLKKPESKICSIS
ncbi:uncharacterized protein [Branchiostoma lanceolatum]|uniref:uncharacterized protein isoform X1 n=1 Tax=Branchiostoma lanceolatum TaxID=7740 RepID=UPI0034539410